MLKCGDGTYYVGSTKDLERRINEHEKGCCWYTSRRLPVELVYYEVYNSIILAKKRECNLRDGLKRKKKL